MWRHVRTVAWLVLAVGPACSDARAPRPGAGIRPRVDAGLADAGQRPDAAAMRSDGGPRFPDAEQDVVLAPGASRVVRIELDADLAALDVHFNVDTTESFSQEIDELQRSLDEIIIGRISERVLAVSFGISRFEDFPGGAYGHAGDERSRPDRPYELLTAITSDRERVATAVAALDQPLGFGGDRPESGAESLWQIATGEGYRADGVSIVAPHGADEPLEGGGIAGGVGFREGALRVVLHITDAPAHGPADYEPEFPRTHSLAQAGAALLGLDVKLLGVVSKNCSGRGCTPVLYEETRADLEALAHATGSVVPMGSGGKCPHGVDGTPVPASEGACPLVFDIAGDGSGLAGTLADAIVDLVDGVRFEAVQAEASDDPLGFVQRIVAVNVPQGADVRPPKLEDRLPEGEPDGSPDTFVGVRAKGRLGFDLHFVNAHVTPSDIDQRFRVRVTILGDGLIVAEHTLRVVVPAFSADASPALDQDAG